MYILDIQRIYVYIYMHIGVYAIIYIYIDIVKGMVSFTLFIFWQAYLSNVGSYFDIISSFPSSFDLLPPALLSGHAIV